MLPGLSSLPKMGTAMKRPAQKVKTIILIAINQHVNLFLSLPYPAISSNFAAILEIPLWHRIHILGTKRLGIVPWDIAAPKFCEG